MKEDIIELIGIGYICRNNEGNRKRDSYTNTISEVERITGITFFPDLPETLEDWTITPALAEGQGEPKLVVEGGKLKFKMGIQPMIILIR